MLRRRSPSEAAVRPRTLPPGWPPPACRRLLSAVWATTHMVARRGPHSDAGGVDAQLATDPRLPTGTCIVIVEPEGERTMIPDAGANDALTAADLDYDLLAAADHL